MPPETSSPAATNVAAPLPSCWAAETIRAVTAAKTVVTGTVRLRAERVAFTNSPILSTFPLESFMPTIFGCDGQLRDHLNRQVVSRAGGHTIKKNRQRRTVSHRLVISQHLPVPHLFTVVMRRTYQDRVILQLCRIIRQAQGFDHALAANPCQQNLLRRGRSPRHAQRLPRLLVAQHDGFAGRAQHHHATHRRARVPVHIRLQLAPVGPSVGIETRRDRSENAFEQHIFYCIPARQMRLSAGFLHPVAN